MQLLNKIRWTGSLWPRLTAFRQDKTEDPQPNGEAIAGLSVTPEISGVIVIAGRKAVA